MKNLKLFLIAIFGLCSAAFSQGPVAKAVIQTPTVQCEACKTKIENRLVREYGVQTVKADHKRRTVTVTFIKDRTNIENIKTAIANLGYDADNVTAEPDAVKRLPITCRHISAVAVQPAAKP